MTVRARSYITLCRPRRAAPVTVSYTSQTVQPNTPLRVSPSHSDMLHHPSTGKLLCKGSNTTTILQSTPLPENPSNTPAFSFLLGLVFFPYIEFD